MGKIFLVLLVITGLTRFPLKEAKGTADRHGHSSTAQNLASPVGRNTHRPVTAATNPDPFAAQKARARQILRPLLHQFPGMVIAVGLCDSVIWEQAFGYADLEKRLPMKPWHRMRYYSVSKPLTGVGAALLMQRGSLKLNAPISRYVRLPEHYRGITVRHLINHSSGIRHYRPGEWPRISRVHCFDTRQALGLFTGDPLLFEPGKGHAYSTYNYVMLSRLIEVASHRSFPGFMEENVLRRAGMKSVFLEGYHPAAFSPVVLYNSRWRPARTVDNSCRCGGGAFAGTAADLVRFGNALLRRRLLSAAMTARVLSTLTGPPGQPTYGFGFGTGKGSFGLPYFAGHTGAGLGGLALFVVFPESDLVLALLANGEGDEQETIRHFVRVAKVFLNKLDRNPIPGTTPLYPPGPG